MYTALALLIVVGISFLMTAGRALAGAWRLPCRRCSGKFEFRHELETDIEPFKGLLLGLFFITVGAGINFVLLFEDATAIISMALLVIIVKGLILFALARAFRLRGRDQWLFALGLAQAGEFGFVLVSFSVKQSVIPLAIAETLLLVIALSMLITAAAVHALRLCCRNGTRPQRSSIPTTRSTSRVRSSSRASGASVRS